MVPPSHSTCPMFSKLMTTFIQVKSKVWFRLDVSSPWMCWLQLCLCLFPSFPSLCFQISNLKKVLKGILDYNQEVREQPYECIKYLLLVWLVFVFLCKFMHGCWSFVCCGLFQSLLLPGRLILKCRARRGVRLEAWGFTSTVSTQYRRALSQHHPSRVYSLDPCSLLYA